MQTFLPYSDFEASAKVLDRARLGKQRVETLQLMKAITGFSSAWGNHPAAKMWKGSIQGLWMYQVAICKEWMNRGYKDTCLAKTTEIVEYAGLTGGLPSWLGNEDFHRAHQSNLVRKNPDHYAKYFPNVPNNLPYIWPTHG